MSNISNNKIPMKLASADEQIYHAIQKEAKRQKEHIELIASENFTSPAVMEAQGSILTNKYAEGYPGKRYYGGCEHIDEVETLAIERAKQLFDCHYVNVQPHSGASANIAVLLSMANPGDTILGLDLGHGGHLTHGSPANFSGRLFNVIAYHRTGDLEHIDYEEMEQLAKEHRPKIIIGGYSAFSNLVDWARIRQIADEVGAIFLCDMAHIAGLIAADVYPSPIPHAHIVTTTTHKTLRGPRGGMILSNSQDEELHKKLNFGIFPFAQGGPLEHVIAGKAVALKEAMEDSFKTYQQQVIINAQTLAKKLNQNGVNTVGKEIHNHIVLLDLSEHGMSGKKAERLLGEANITTNKNAIPNDPRSPFVTSGIRLGTPAVTTRGVKQEQIEIIADWITEILNGSDPNALKRDVITMMTQLPLYS